MSEQDRLDMILYGQVLKGKGPWPMGPKKQAERKLRQEWHNGAYGKDQKCPSSGCPVCRTFNINIS